MARKINYESGESSASEFPYKAEVIVNTLNVRESPGGNVVTTLRIGETCKIIAISDDWGQLESGGYVLLQFTRRK